MKKQRISKVLDTLETLGEIPKRATQDALKTINPLDMLGDQLAQPTETTQSGEQPKPTDHTPLKIDKVKGQHEVNNLKKARSKEDDLKLNALRERLFRSVKAEEKKAIQDKEQEVKEKKEVELSEEQKKQEDIKQRLAARQNGDAPQGKTGRGGLFAKKKKRTSNAVSENFAEMKGSGKH